MNEWTNRYSRLETKVGGGFYALRKNVSKAGIEYSKLVKADRSPAPSGLLSMQNIQERV